MSKGIAIGSGIHIDQFTHIEATRYSRGSDVLRPVATMLTGGRAGIASARGSAPSASGDAVLSRASAACAVRLRAARR